MGQGMKKLKVVSMRGSAIKKLPNKLFAKNPSLKCLILKDSELSEISIEVFSSNIDKKLKEVDLRKPGRKSFEKIFQGKEKDFKFFEIDKLNEKTNYYCKRIKISTFRKT